MQIQQRGDSLADLGQGVAAIWAILGGNFRRAQKSVRISNRCDYHLAYGAESVVRTGAASRLGRLSQLLSAVRTKPPGMGDKRTAVWTLLTNGFHWWISFLCYSRPGWLTSAVPHLWQCFGVLFLTKATPGLKKSCPETAFKASWTPIPCSGLTVG